MARLLDFLRAATGSHKSSSSNSSSSSTSRSGPSSSAAGAATPLSPSPSPPPSAVARHLRQGTLSLLRDTAGAPVFPASPPPPAAPPAAAPAPDAHRADDEAVAGSDVAAMCCYHCGLPSPATTPPRRPTPAPTMSASDEVLPAGFTRRPNFLHRQASANRSPPRRARDSGSGGSPPPRASPPAIASSPRRRAANTGSSPAIVDRLRAKASELKADLAAERDARRKVDRTLRNVLRERDALRNEVVDLRAAVAQYESIVGYLESQVAATTPLPYTRPPPLRDISAQSARSFSPARISVARRTRRPSAGMPSGLNSGATLRTAVTDTGPRGRTLQKSPWGKVRRKLRRVWSSTRDLFHHHDDDDDDDEDYLDAAIPDTRSIASTPADSGFASDPTLTSPLLEPARPRALTAPPQQQLTPRASFVDALPPMPVPAIIAEPPARNVSLIQGLAPAIATPSTQSPFAVSLPPSDTRARSRSRSPSPNQPIPRPASRQHRTTVTGGTAHGSMSSSTHSPRRGARGSSGELGIGVPVSWTDVEPLNPAMRQLHFQQQRMQHRPDSTSSTLSNWLVQLLTDVDGAPLSSSPPRNVPASLAEPRGRTSDAARTATRSAPDHYAAFHPLLAVLNDPAPPPVPAISPLAASAAREVPPAPVHHDSLPATEALALATAHLAPPAEEEEEAAVDTPTTLRHSLDPFTAQVLRRAGGLPTGSSGATDGTLFHNGSKAGGGGSFYFPHGNESHPSSLAASSPKQRAASASSLATTVGVSGNPRASVAADPTPAPPMPPLPQPNPDWPSSSPGDLRPLTVAAPLAVAAAPAPPVKTPNSPLTPSNSHGSLSSAGTAASASTSSSSRLHRNRRFSGHAIATSIRSVLHVNTGSGGSSSSKRASMDTVGSPVLRRFSIGGGGSGNVTPSSPATAAASLHSVPEHAPVGTLATGAAGAAE
ncbi:hypothetical protein H9P43_003714 [Blastocladiella emersonii ATCC 22665]|nr:hypothetical protein H9P43_003714 [Blastocladiella emersonii ATCC 22665]